MTKTKRILSAAVFCMLVVCFAAPASAAQAQTTIAVDNVLINGGTEATVPIRIWNNTGICGAAVSVHYDERLILKSISKGTALPSLTMTCSGGIAPNPVNIVWDGTDADSTNGIMVFLTFMPPAGSGMYSISISFEGENIVDNALHPVAVQHKNGGITVSETEDIPYIFAEKVYKSAGGSIDVPIHIAGNTGICGAAVSVYYDRRLSLTKISKGTALSSLTMTCSGGGIAPNPVKIVWDGMEQDTTNGIIAVLTFTVPQSNGKYAVNLSYEQGDIVNGHLVPLEVEMGQGLILVRDSAEVLVVVGEESVTMKGDIGSGKVTVAFYDAAGELLLFHSYMPAEGTIREESVPPNAATAKILWWGEGLQPVGDKKVIDLQ